MQLQKTVLIGLSQKPR